MVVLFKPPECRSHQKTYSCRFRHRLQYWEFTYAGRWLRVRHHRGFLLNWPYDRNTLVLLHRFQAMAAAQSALRAPLWMCWLEDSHSGAAVHFSIVRSVYEHSYLSFLTRLALCQTGARPFMLCIFLLAAFYTPGSISAIICLFPP